MEKLTVEKSISRFAENLKKYFDFSIEKLLLGQKDSRFQHGIQVPLTSSWFCKGAQFV